jgi:hypothetical protein
MSWLLKSRFCYLSLLLGMNKVREFNSTMLVDKICVYITMIMSKISDSNLYKDLRFDLESNLD